MPPRRPPPPTLRQAAALAVALVVPPACVVCRRSAEAVVCGDCLRALPWLRGHRCPRCALPRHRAGCPAAAAAFDRAWAPLAHEGAARALVHALKFRASLPVADVMAAHIAANLPTDLRHPIVPVPPDRRRRRRRGFDPAAMLAERVAARAGLPLSACLRRTDHGHRQLGAGRHLRRSAGRFAAVATADLPPRVVLVDDVHTTGATLDACAKALKERGAEWVGAATYVRTL